MCRRPQSQYVATDETTRGGFTCEQGPPEKNFRCMFQDCAVLKHAQLRRIEYATIDATIV